MDTRGSWAAAPALAGGRAYDSSRRTGTSGGFALGTLGTRRQRFWFGILGILALALPYSSATVAAIRAALDPPVATVVLPALSIPQARFPGLAIPTLATNPAAASSQAPPASPGATSGTRVVRRSAGAPGARRLVRTQRRSRSALRKLPVVTNSYGLSAAKPRSAHAHPSAGAVSALAQALAAAPKVTDVAPPLPPMPAPAPAVAPPLPQPVASQPVSATVSGNPPPVSAPAISSPRRAEPLRPHSVISAAAPDSAANGSQSSGPQATAGGPSAPS